MKVMIIGSGGREHALAWKLSGSSKLTKLYCIPGNGGIAALAECVNMDMMDFPSLIRFAKEKQIELTVVGPEVPLTEGIVDAFEKEGLRIFGPSKAAAALEGSKAYAKDFMKRHGIPTAGYHVFSDMAEALTHAKLAHLPCVIKADGVAAGKGVIIAENRDEAVLAIEQIMHDKKFGRAGEQVVIEDFLEGEEVSVLAVSDGHTILPLLPAQDHKRAYDGDLGPNTGGMGAYAPAPICTPELLAWIKTHILDVTIQGMKEEGRPFKGVLYAGLMITKEGPKVLEYNTRFGDPETQPILFLLENDLIEVIMAVMEERLSTQNLVWYPGSAVCVVLASGGYPEHSEKGKRITIAEGSEHAEVFHAGTVLDAHGNYLTNGGRVLGITAKGKDLREATARAYKTISAIHFEGMQYRKDIGKKGME